MVRGANVTAISYSGLDEGDYATIECGNGTMYFEDTDHLTRINVTCIIQGVEAIWGGLNETVCLGKWLSYIVL